MKHLLMLALLLSLVFLAPPGLAVADEDGDGGGSIFDQPGDEEEEPEAEPEPKTISFRDYHLEMKTEDGRWWRVNKISIDELEKKGIMLNLTFKLPKSSDPVDVTWFGQGWKHNVSAEFSDGTKIRTSNYQILAEKYYSEDMKRWKEVRDPEEPKKVRLSRDVKNAYRYAFTGLHPGNGRPLHREVYVFKFKDKTYFMQIQFSTTASKNKRITDDVAAMLKSIKEKKTQRR